MKKTTLYQKSRLGKTQQWEIWVEPKGKSGHPEVWIQHGQQGGKQQTTFDVVEAGVNEGKANATTPLQQAQLEAERKITKQLEHGYVRDLADLNKQQLTIDFSQPLPKSLCFYKPKNSIEPEKIERLEKAKKAIYTVKRDGFMHLCRTSKKFGAEIYSRRMDLVSTKFPHLLQALLGLPTDTILLGEVILDKNGVDDFNSASSICRSDPEEAILKQKTLGQVSYYVFDLAFYKGQNLLTTKTFQERRELLVKVLSDLGSKWVFPAEVVSKKHSEALKEMKKRKLEGLVIWDADGKMEDGSAFTLNGKAYRPNVLFKSKPSYEDDFIVRWDPEKGIGEYGSGKNHGKLKSVALYQLDSAGKEICLGNCGGGLSDEQRTLYTNKKLFPRVWRIEYDKIQAGTGALRFPVFSLDRTMAGDKELSECLLGDDVKKAREQKEEEDDE